ncbi:hypothetical protein [Paludisphaera sp.]|uniref:hypothetical protein n=1 Tax=Paludisphaera sp. TaxID=2017432 RepID=UPI00301CDEE1
MKRAAAVALLALSLALAWSAFVRAPLIVNAPTHLDSDLAVDGMTLREAVDGRWRWQYPGTPYMGTGAVLLSYPQAKVWGVTPETLASGGTVAYLLLICGVFATAWACRGPKVAAWSLVPLAFASTGTIWLTGRVTGGHMLAAAWSAWAWAMFAWFARRGGKGGGALLGLWLGLGMWHDSMFLMTIVGMATAGLVLAVATRGAWTRRSALGFMLALAAGFAIGQAPKPIGRWLEPYDAYGGQFAWSLDPELLRDHARILFLDCLPRIVAGHRLPGLEADPDPELIGGGSPLTRPGRGDAGAIAIATTALGLLMFAASFTALKWRVVRRASPSDDPRTPVERAIALGLLVSSAAILAGFVVNRNIFDADNQRYLVLWLIPGALGFGMVMDALAARGAGGKLAAAGIATAFALAFAADSLAWYRRLGWVDERGSVVRRPVDDPALRWLDEHPEVGAFTAGYWDVYRLAFLADRPVRGTPYPIYPDRYPEWSRDLPGGRPTILIARPTLQDQHFLREALEAGGEVLFRGRGTTIATWPVAPPVNVD